LRLPAKEDPKQERVPPRGWEGELERWRAPFLAMLNREAQRRWAPIYLKGLLLPGERKSVEPLAARVAPGSTEQLHHFIGGSPWASAPLEAVLRREADRLVGGPDAVLVVDDTALPKQGRHSVGVARQYCGCLGKRANCQVLVSLTMARAEVPVPVGLRLFLPAVWTDDPERCARAGVPEERRRPLAKTEIALEEIERVIAAGVRFGRVVTDAGYGISAAFRQGLSARGLLWAAGIPKVQNVYPSGVELGWPVARTGRPRKHPVPSADPLPAEAALEGAAWRRVEWRRGTKGPLAAEFAGLRVRPAEGAQLRNGRTCRGTRSGSWANGAPPASASTTSATSRPIPRSRPWRR
jgi:SRSO17 transposase